MFFVAGTATSSGDFMKSGCRGRLGPGLVEWPGLVLMASFVVIWVPHPAQASGKLNCFVGSLPQPHPTPEIWAASGPGAHKEGLAEIKNEEAGMAAPCGMWVLGPQCPAVQGK